MATTQTELDSAQSTIQGLTRRASEDKEAITELMTTVRQLREVQGAEEANMAALRLDCETRDVQLKESSDKLDKVVSMGGGRERSNRREERERYIQSTLLYLSPRLS